MLPNGASSGTAASSVRSFGFARADVAADFPVDEPERVCHHVAYVGQAQQHQRDAQDGIENSHHLAPVRFRSNMAVTCNTKIIF